MLEYLPPTSMTPHKPRPLQKFSLFMGWLSFILAVVCAVFFFIKKEDLGIRDPITTSFMASMFFFICVGGLAFVMGKADIPDFKVRRDEKED